MVAQMETTFDAEAADKEHDDFISDTLAGLNPSRKQTHFELVGAWMYETYKGADKGKLLLTGWHGDQVKCNAFWRTYTGTVDGLELNRQIVEMAEHDDKQIRKELLHGVTDDTKPEEKQPKPRFALSWASSAWENPEPLDFLVEGLITKPSVNLLVGEPGSKKTYSAVDLAVCVALGRDWLDFKLKQATVLIIDEESGERRLRKRLYEAFNGHLIKEGTELPLGFTSLDMMNLQNDEDVTALHLLIEQTGAELVIIDALADVTAGADENSTQHMQPLFLKLRKVANATNSAIIVIHHANKATGKYRGSTSIKGAIDLLLMCESEPKSKFVNFKTDKTRDIPEQEFSAVANFVPAKEQFWLSSADVREKGKKLSMAQQDVLSYLLTHGNSLLGDMLKSKENDMTSAPNTRKEAYQNFVNSGHIIRTNAGSRGVPAEIELTEKGLELAEGLK